VNAATNHLFCRGFGHTGGPHAPQGCGAWKRHHGVAGWTWVEFGRRATPCRLGSTALHLPALGYRYQTTWALLELLRRAPGRPDASISLEMHDDVAWDADGSPEELLSLKHHVNTTRNLADGSDDLWRTLRVWMDTANPGDPHGHTLTLVTTASAAAGSILAVGGKRSSRDKRPKPAVHPRSERCSSSDLILGKLRLTAWK
jgi:hypothetical protein